MKILKLLLLLPIFLLLNNCGIYKPVSAKDFPPNPEDRIKKNLEEYVSHF